MEVTEAEVQKVKNLVEYAMKEDMWTNKFYTPLGGFVLLELFHCNFVAAIEVTDSEHPEIARDEAVELASAALRFIHVGFGKNDPEGEGLVTRVCDELREIPDCPSVLDFIGSLRLAVSRVWNSLEKSFPATGTNIENDVAVIAALCIWFVSFYRPEETANQQP